MRCWKYQGLERRSSHPEKWQRSGRENSFRAGDPSLQGLRVTAGSGEKFRAARSKISGRCEGVRVYNMREAGAQRFWA